VGAGNDLHSAVFLKGHLMTIDDEVLEQMNLTPEDPQRVVKTKPRYAKSKFNEEQLEAQALGGKIWVKCVSENQPWADGKPLRFWEDYLILVHEAILLDERLFAVILKPL
jgi:hypothetical protein